MRIIKNSIKMKIRKQNTREITLKVNKKFDSNQHEALFLFFIVFVFLDSYSMF